MLIAADGSLRLCDFGSASTHEGVCDTKTDRLEQEDFILRYTTPNFRAPEMCDLYSGLPLDARRCVRGGWGGCCPARAQPPTLARP